MAKVVCALLARETQAESLLCEDGLLFVTLDQVFVCVPCAHCNVLQRTATRCNALQRTATQCNALQHTATHCNTLQHTATHYNISHPYTPTHAHTSTHTKKYTRAHAHTHNVTQTPCAHADRMCAHRQDVRLECDIWQLYRLKVSYTRDIRTPQHTATSWA